LKSDTKNLSIGYWYRQMQMKERYFNLFYQKNHIISPKDEFVDLTKDLNLEIAMTRTILHIRRIIKNISWIIPSGTLLEMKLETPNARYC
jgi:hypothetical protein